MRIHYKNDDYANVYTIYHTHFESYLREHVHPGILIYEFTYFYLARKIFS